MKLNNIQEKYIGKQIDCIEILNISALAKSLAGKPSIIVTGVTGQDGSHMVDFLLENTDYEIIGCVRRLSVYNHKNICHISNPRFKLVNFDLNDQNSVSRLIELVKPKYFINLAAQSFVGNSWDFPLQTWDTNASAVLSILEAIRFYNPECRFYQAGSSEEFGEIIFTPQSEEHPLMPRSPYGASKAAARQILNVWRKSYKLYAVQGWLFNHEGIRRGEEFISRKISIGVAKIKSALNDNKEIKCIEIGNLESRRDWSDAEDFVEAIWLNLNQNQPVDYVLSSDEVHSVREFVELAFQAVNIKYEWVGTGTNEKLLHVNTGKTLLSVNPKYFRPIESNVLVGDSRRARTELGWQPKIGFRQLVEKMVLNDLNIISSVR